MRTRLAAEYANIGRNSPPRPAAVAVKGTATAVPSVTADLTLSSNMHTFDFDEVLHHLIVRAIHISIDICINHQLIVLTSWEQ